MGIYFETKAWEQYNKLEKKDKEKACKIIKELERGKNVSHAEPLKYMAGCRSVRINEKDRIVYRYDDGVLVVLRCDGHYGDH
jgi:toxin YoeB